MARKLTFLITFSPFNWQRIMLRHDKIKRIAFLQFGPIDIGAFW